MQNEEIIVTSLVDSGCSGRRFVDRFFVKHHKLHVCPTPSRRPLLLADGRPSDVITEYIIIPCRIGSHHELAIFLVTNLAPDTPLIFGLPWLRCHNPIIDWETLSLTFASGYCHRFCLPEGMTNCEATIIYDKVRVQDIVVPGEPNIPHAPSVPATLPQLCTTYQRPTVEDCTEKVPEQQVKASSAQTLHIEKTLSPGRDHFITYHTETAVEPKLHARMIPTPHQTKPIPTSTVGGVRRKNRPPPKNRVLPQLSIPLPQPVSTTELTPDRPDMTNIRMLGASSFVQFCCQPGVQATRLF